MAVTFRYAQDTEYPRIKEFLHQHWAPNHLYVRMPEMFEWTFGKGHFLVEKPYHAVIAEDQGELVGFLGGIPFVLNVHGNSKRGVWLANHLLRADYRKGTLGLQLLNAFRQKENNAVIAFGMNPAGVPMYRLLKADVLLSIPRHVLLFPDAASRAHRLLHVAYPDWPQEKSDALIKALTASRLPSQPGEFFAGLPEDWDRQGWSVLAPQTVGCARNGAYLRWRFSHHPCFEYRMIAVGSGDGMGLAVWRLETIRAVSQQGLEDFDKIGRLVEFLAPSREVAARLWNAYVAELLAADALGTDYYGFHGQTGRWLRELGFVCVDDHPDGPAFPSRFQPLDGKGGPLVSAVFLDADLPRCQTGPDCLWYWTKSDSDQDRPT
jgi:hypothetical protein